MQKKDAIIVLDGHRSASATQLNHESELRLDRGIGLLKKGAAEVIIVRSSLILPEIMANRLLSHNIPLEKVRYYTHPGDRIDTIGEAYFIKMQHLEKNMWRNNLVITSNYHLNRAQMIYSHILGPAYSTEFEGVETVNDNDPEVLAKEKRSLEIFLKQFGGIEPGDSQSIGNRLYEVHELYEGMPPELRLRYFN